METSLRDNYSATLSVNPRLLTVAIRFPMDAVGDFALNSDKLIYAVIPQKLCKGKQELTHISPRSINIWQLF